MLIYAFYPNGLIEQWGNATTNTNASESAMLKINFDVIYTENPIVEVSQNYNESGHSVGLQSFNITKESFQINAKNVVIDDDYYARKFNYFVKGH